MKKVIYFVLAALVCSCTNNSFTLTGVAEGVVVGDSIMVCSYYDSSVRYAATAVTYDGEFELSGTVDEPTIAALVINNTSLIGAFFLEAGKITVEASEIGVVFGGSPINEAYNSYNMKSATFEEQYISIDATLPAEDILAQQEAIYEGYIALVAETVESNLDNILGAFVFANDEFSILTTSESKVRFEQFTPKMQSVEFMQDVSLAIEAMLRTEVGQPYIDVALVDVAGNAVAISQLLAEGKYVLVDFWATWCGPCLAEMPHLKSAYADFKGKGFEIYGISLDRDANAWRAMVDSTMPWVNVIDSPEVAASEIYAIRTIPTNFLVSPEGLIVAKNLRGEEIAPTLSEYLQ